MIKVYKDDKPLKPCPLPKCGCPALRGDSGPVAKCSGESCSMGITWILVDDWQDLPRQITEVWAVSHGVDLGTDYYAAKENATKRNQEIEHSFLYRVKLKDETYNTLPAFGEKEVTRDLLAEGRKLAESIPDLSAGSSDMKKTVRSSSAKPLCKECGASLGRCERKTGVCLDCVEGMMYGD